MWDESIHVFINIRTPPGLGGSAVSQAFAVGIKCARDALGHTRRFSLTSPPSISASLIPPRSYSSNLNRRAYVTAPRALVPAYSYQPTLPSPLRVQVGMHRVYRTIIEEPRTSHSEITAPAPAPSLPPLSFSHMYSTVGPAQRTRPTFASHVRNPRSTENIRKFTFPARQSLNDIELQITVSEVLRDDGLLAERERSETPNGVNAPGHRGVDLECEGAASGTYWGNEA